jgi:hypothetical protein
MLNCYAGGVRDKSHCIISRVDNYGLVSCPLVFFPSQSPLSRRVIVISLSKHTKSTVTAAGTTVDVVLG